MSCKKIHPFHLVEFSPWPIRVAFRAMGIVRGLVNVFDPQPIWFTLPPLIIVTIITIIKPQTIYTIKLGVIHQFIIFIITWSFFIHNSLPFLPNLLIYGVIIYLHALFNTFAEDWFLNRNNKPKILSALKVITRKVFWGLVLRAYSLKYIFNINVHTNLLIISSILFIISISLWFKDIIRERTFQGKHTLIVQKGLRWGIILFIISEVIFFASFFWAFFHRRINPSIAIGCQWPPWGIQTFNPSQIPLLNTLVLLLRGATLTYAHHNFIYKGLDYAKNFENSRGPIRLTDEVLTKRHEIYKLYIDPYDLPWDKEKHTCPFIEQNRYETPKQSQRRWTKAFGFHVSFQFIGIIIEAYYNRFNISKKVWFKTWWNKAPGERYDVPQVPGLGYTFIRYTLPYLNTESAGPAYHLGCYHTRILHSESIWIKFTIILGALFIIIQLLEYLEAPFTISRSIYGRVFFLTTGFHGFHVFVGTVFLTVALVRMKKFHFTPKQHLGLEFAAWYWHFVDIIWLLLYLSIYYWGSIPEDTLFITIL